MMLELTANERDILVSLVSRELAEIGPEIHHTRTREYREELKVQRQVMEQLLDHLRPAAAIVPHASPEVWQPGAGVTVDR
jgi:hypothetical protein